MLVHSVHFSICLYLARCCLVCSWACFSGSRIIIIIIIIIGFFIMIIIFITVLLFLCFKVIITFLPTTKTVKWRRDPVLHPEMPNGRSLQMHARHAMPSHRLLNAIVSNVAWQTQFTPVFYCRPTAKLSLSAYWISNIHLLGLFLCSLLVLQFGQTLSNSCVWLRYVTWPLSAAFALSSF